MSKQKANEIEKDEVDVYVSSTGDFVRLPQRDGEPVQYQFFNDKTKRTLVTRVFTDNKTGEKTESQKVQYMVLLPEDREAGEKKLDTPKTLASQIEDNIRRNHNLLDITRRGIGPNTRYNAIAAD